MKITNHLKLREARNGCVVHDDGSLHVVLQIIPTASKIDLEKREQIFLQICRNLDLRIQITSRMVNANLAQKILAYKATKEKEILHSKKLTSEHLASFRRFMIWFTQFCNTHIAQERLHYITIYSTPLYKSFWHKKRKSNLAFFQKRVLSQAAKIAHLLKVAGFHARLLKEQDLIALYSSYYAFSIYDNHGQYLTIDQFYQKWLELGDEL